MRLSIIIPAYNEEKRIAATLYKLINFFDQKFSEYEIIVVMDGCKDDTPKIVYNIMKNGEYIIVPLVYKQRLGKGKAIIKGLEKAKGDIILITDSDLPVPLKDLYKMIEKTHTYDLVIGSRYRPESRILARESIMRIFLSRIFNILVRTMFWSLKDIKDTQCGAKVFKRNLLRIKNELMISDFTFDVNFVYSAKRHHFKIKEMGVTWRHREEGSKVSGKLLRIGYVMFLSLLRLRIYYSPYRRIMYLEPFRSFILNLYRKLRG